MISSISGVILAGGASRRFGGIQKAKLLAGGTTIISRIISAIGELFPEIIIVTNTPGGFEDLQGCIVTRDHFLNACPLAGIHAAIRASSCSAVFVFAGDMPLIDRDIVKRQAEAFFESDYEILIPRRGDLTEPLHSVFRVSILHDLEKYLTEKHDRSVRDFIAGRHTGFFELEDTPATKRAFTNINSPSDFRKFRTDYYL